MTLSKQPDIDKILDDIFEMGVSHGKGLWNDYPTLKKGVKQALYHRLAAEAETVEFPYEVGGEYERPAISITKLKAIMEIKE